MEFKEEKNCNQQVWEKIIQNIHINKKKRFKKHSTVKITWQQRRANELQYDTPAKTILFRFHIQHRNS